MDDRTIAPGRRVEAGITDDVAPDVEEQRRRAAELRAEIADLRAAAERRAVIEQAKGVIMATTGCDADAAFEVLVAQSHSENRKVRDIAAELMRAQRRGPTPGPPVAVRTSGAPHERLPRTGRS